MPDRGREYLSSLRTSLAAEGVEADSICLHMALFGAAAQLRPDRPPFPFPWKAAEKK